MRKVLGLKIGGLQQKIINLVLVFILALVAAYVGVSLYQYRALNDTVGEAAERQQASIVSVSEETMEAVLESAMAKATGLQVTIAGDLFDDVRSDILTLQAFATELFENADSLSAHPFHAPRAEDDGKAVAYALSEPGVDPEDSPSLGLVANMSEIMVAMYEASDKLSGCFIGTADGNLLAVSDRSGTCLLADGTPMTIDVRNRPWYQKAAQAGELVFTGVEEDSYTGIATLECAAPIYADGELVAVVGADIFLTAISDYVESAATDGGFVCVVSENGQVLFSPCDEGAFKPDLSAVAPDLRRSENAELAGFVTKALAGTTGLEAVTVDGVEYYMAGAPVSAVGWAVLSVVDRATTHQPTEWMLAQYDEINREATESFQATVADSQRGTVLLTLLLLALAVAAALMVAGRVVKPLEAMTRRINALSGSDQAFEMEKVYKTNDEIEILAESFAALSQKTRDYIARITEITAEKERIGTELALATRIQADMLPNIYPAFPDRPEFDIYASMTPAKEVGGDFYDFFLIDDDHLCVVMADVSGKGVPAALFMMASKIILANNAMTGKSPAQILTDTNAAICQNNREEMFVTVWLGILDLNTGTLTAANAGHEYPALRKPDGSFELFKDKHGFVIGGMDGARYKEYTIQMEPGAKLFVYTDGVPEATDADNELFGTDRMLAALNSQPEADPENILKNVAQAVDAFVRDAPQFDDLTMLCLEYKGELGMSGNGKELTIPAQVERLPEALGFLERELEAVGCPPKAQTQLVVAAEEIFVNIARYAYAPGTGEATLRLEITEEPPAATVTFLDSGVPFNPLEKPDPDVTLPAEDREIGGLGIFMTKKVMDEVRYEYRDGKNVLAIKKRFNG